jgi:hypothetical protein
MSSCPSLRLAMSPGMEKLGARNTADLMRIVLTS